MIFDFVCKFFRISFCLLLLIWSADLLCHFGEDEEVNLFRLREKQKEEAVLMNTSWLETSLRAL